MSYFEKKDRWYLTFLAVYMLLLGPAVIFGIFGYLFLPDARHTKHKVRYHTIFVLDNNTVYDDREGQYIRFEDEPRDKYPLVWQAIQESNGVGPSHEDCFYNGSVALRNALELKDLLNEPIR